MTHIKPDVVPDFNPCHRHEVRHKECPFCNKEAYGVAHVDNNRKLRIVVPVFRKRAVYKGKTYNKKPMGGSYGV